MDHEHSQKNNSSRLVRIEDLGSLIKEKRKKEGLTLEQAAIQSGVSAPTLSRWERQEFIIQKNYQPDTRTLGLIVKWLGVSLDRVVSVDIPPVMHSVIHHEGDSVPDIVEAHLRADKNLNGKTAAALNRLFRVAYEQFASVENQAIQDGPKQDTQPEN
jgi:transcriptional regulator with XRE-family HTH domain